MSKMAEHYLGDTPYPESPGFKQNTTSREAAKAVKPGAVNGREVVFRAILLAGPDGITADEAAAAIGRPVLYVRPRVTELAKLNRIEATGERRANTSRLKATVWRAK